MSQEIQNEVITEIEAQEQPAAEEAIALGTSEEIAENIEQPAETIEEPAAEVKAEEKPKKKSKAGKVIGGILIGLLALVLVVLIGAGILAAVLVNKATVEVDMPEKVEASNMAMFGAEAAVGLLANDEIIVGNDDMQMLIDKVKPSLETALAGTPISLKDLSCVLADDQGTIYAQVYISELDVKGINIKLDKTVTISAAIDINFNETADGQFIVAHINELKAGDLSIPVSLITPFLSGVQLPEDLKIAGEEIAYNVSGLDAMLDEMLPQAMESGLGDNALSSFLSDLLVKETDVEITGADIVGDELVINGHLF